MFELIFLFMTTSAVSRHVAGFAGEILPSLPGMNDLMVLSFATGANLYLLAVPIFFIAPVAAMKTEGAFTFIEKLFQHL